MSEEEIKDVPAEKPAPSRPRWGRILVWVGVLALLGLLALGLRRTQQGPVGVGTTRA